MKKINNKGMTVIEVIVTFSMPWTWICGPEAAYTLNDDKNNKHTENDNFIKITVSKTNKSVLNSLLNTRLNKVRITKTLNLNEESEAPYGD